MVYFLLAGAVTACAPTACLMATRPRGGTAETAPTPAQFSDIPIPRGVATDLESALIFAPGEGRIGRPVYTTYLRTEDALAFYGCEMSDFGRQETARGRARINITTTYAARGRRQSRSSTGHSAGPRSTSRSRPRAQQASATGTVVPVRSPFRLPPMTGRVSGATTTTKTAPRGNSGLQQAHGNRMPGYGPGRRL